MRALLIPLVVIVGIAAANPPTASKMSWIFELTNRAKPNDPRGLLCSDLDQADQTAVHYWITGYFSGVNFDAGRTVGHSMEEARLVDEVKQLCKQRPDVPVQMAAQAAYEKLQTEGR